MNTSRVLLASNRLPISVVHGADGPSFVPSSGGLATALRELHAEASSRWAGWVGDVSDVPEEAQGRIASQLAARRLVSIPLSPEEIDLYYDGYSNAVLWPLFHYSLDRVRLDAGREWEAYRTVNQRFAETLAQEMNPGDRVWVHDYHLMLVPSYLRRLVPGARIGFFLHIPWPSSDLFRILPNRREILAGLLGADLIGFHTESYRHNFIHSAAKILGIDLGIDALHWGDRHVRIGVFPIGIEVAAFERKSGHVDELVAEIRAGTGGKTTLLGVDRLDYTKGVPRRLMAFDRLLEREPSLRERVHFIQLAVPTRENVDAYTTLRSTVNELVGRINSQYGSATGSPIQLLYRSVGADDLLALYRAADVMLVTPQRDGMNLVAKEYVASRIDETGALVLSEFAGAASELDAALIVNPYDIDGTAEAMHRAIFMPKSEQRVRMRKLRAAVQDHPVTLWASNFMDDLSRAEPRDFSGVSSSREVQLALGRLRAAAHRVMLLDYDGTLVPIAALPDLASPDDAVLSLLKQLALLPNTEVHVVSGRSRSSLEEWLGRLPIALHTEHGFWSRDTEGNWSQVRDVPPDFLRHTFELMKSHAGKTPGAFVEQKSASMAFHYRGADPHIADARLRALRQDLSVELGEHAELLEGNKVLEVRLRGVHKGTVVEQTRRGAPPGALFFAAGDDRTDEDLFAALPENAISVRIGSGATRADLRLESPFDLRRFLQELIDGGPQQPERRDAAHNSA